MCGFARIRNRNETGYYHQSFYSNLSTVLQIWEYFRTQATRKCYAPNAIFIVTTYQRAVHEKLQTKVKSFN